MKVVEKLVNEVHEDAMPRPLAPGETALYRLKGGVENPDNEGRKKAPILWPQSVTIPSKDRIKIKHKDGKEKLVDIAVVADIEDDKVIPVKLAIPARANNGYIHLTGGNIRDEEIYEFLELTNRNESNPNRDKSITPLFYRINEAQDAKGRNQKRSDKLLAMKYVEESTNGEIKKIAASLNWDETVDIEILRDRMGEWAEKNAADFIKAVRSNNTEVKATIKEALTAGKISFDAQQHRYVLNGQTLIKLDRVEGVDHLDQAADWIKNHKNGSKVYEQIKKLSTSTEGATDEK